MKLSEQCHYDQFLSALASESRLALLERLAVCCRRLFDQLNLREEVTG